MNPSVHMRSSDQLHECPLGHTYQCCQSSLSKVVAFGHNELWRQKAATVTSKLDKISPNGNTAEELRSTVTSYHVSLTTNLGKIAKWQYCKPELLSANDNNNNKCLSKFRLRNWGIKYFHIIILYRSVCRILSSESEQYAGTPAKSFLQPSASAAARSMSKLGPVLPFGDILANLVATFAAFGSHCSLWPKATTFVRSQRPSSWPSTAIVRCGYRPQQLRGHR